MKYQTWKKLEEYMKNNKVLLVEICNDYGESGFIYGKINENILNDNRHYAFYFDVKIKNSKEPITLDLLIERPVIMRDVLFGKNGEKKAENLDKFNTFDVLRIIDPETERTIFKNPNKKTLLNLPVNSKNFNYNDKSNRDWREKESTKFLLANIGQYIEIKQGEEVFGGILKSIYKLKDEKETYLTLVQSSHHACVKVLKDNTKIKTYSRLVDKRNFTYKEEKEKELEMVK